MTDQTQPKTVESPIDHIVVLDHGNSFVQVHHDTPEVDRAEAGFDLTDFDTAETFERLLADLDLLPAMTYNSDHYDPVPDPQYAKVGKAPDDPERDLGVYVWANQKLALLTGNNPLTGEYSDPSMRPDEPGYASYIGLSGTPEAVEEAYTAVQEYATHIKDRSPESRDYI